MAYIWWWYASGTIKSANAFIDGKTVAIATKIRGQVLEAPVKVGDSVKKGQLLFRLDSSDYDTLAAEARAFLARIAATLPPQALVQHPDKAPQHEGKTLADARAEENALRKAVEAASDAQARAAVALAASQQHAARQKTDAIASARQADEAARVALEKAKNDFEKASYVRATLEAEERKSSDAQVPAALAAQVALYNAQLAQVRQAEAKRTAAVVLAPFSGQIVEVAIQAGQEVTPGSAGVRLLPATESGLWITAEFTPGQAAGLVAGQECDITLRNEITVKGRIADLPTAPAQGQKNLAVRVIFSDYASLPSGLAIGESAVVNVAARSPKATPPAGTNATKQ